MTSALAVLLAAVAAFLLSGAWYAAFGSRLATWSPAYAGPQPPPALTAVVELVRNLVLGGVLAVLVDRTGASGVVDGIGLGLLTWVGFPLVLLSGSVFHEKVPAPLAAVHLGDWLLKLVVVGGVVATLG